MDDAGDHRVVVGVSGSLGSLSALHRAAEARRTGAVLVTVPAWRPPGGAFLRPGGSRPPLPDVRQVRARQRLVDAGECAFGGLPEDLPMRALIVRGTAGRALTQVADRPDDVLVLERAGGGACWSRMLSRSVARHCLVHAACPVLAVPRSPLHDVLEDLRRRDARWLPLHIASSLR
ncbi:universal stress protein [Streptomyces sp. ME19-03-3]|nr:universal stress protein [Streptomyces sp. ME19-03-3]